MSDQTCNGWTNYATWRVNLEICEDHLNGLLQDTYPGSRFDSVEALADYLAEYVDDVLTNWGNLDEGFALDYARAFVSDVNWYEIAEHAEELIASDEEEEDEE